MHGKITIGIVLLSLTLIATACAGSSSPVAPQPAQDPVNLTPVSQTSPAAPAAAASAASVSPKPSGPIKAIEIVAAVANDTVTIPLSAVQKDWNVHFLVDVPGGKQSFMAYNLGDQLYVRASICPPCRGKTYSLDGNTLVCDTCATTFNAQTGIGIAGGCVNYPKASVSYQVSSGNIVMKVSDLETAYQNTLKAGLP